MQFIPDEQIEWVNVPMIKEDWKLPDSPYQYEFMLPRPLADWDVFSYWEKPRLDSMKKHLKQGDVLFDIGTEQGWCNLIYASFVGPENMVLIEPTKEFWPNIRKTWEKNYDVSPLFAYRGLISNETSENFADGFDIWDRATGDIIDRNKYQYIHDYDPDTPVITLDMFVEQTGIVPDAITMDIEGAEFLALLGAQQTLKRHLPKLWVSIHHDLSMRHYAISKKVTLDFLTDMGYEATHLSTDHEEHWLFK